MDVKAGYCIYYLKKNYIGESPGVGGKPLDQANLHRPIGRHAHPTGCTNVDGPGPPAAPPHRLLVRRRSHRRRPGRSARAVAAFCTWAAASTVVALRLTLRHAAE
jgi:hypothetical protein